MKKTIKELSSKSIQNTATVKGGANGKGTKNTASTVATRAQLL